MANNQKNIKTVKPSVEKTDGEKIARYAKSAYFQEKDKKATEFLKKHPLPKEFSEPKKAKKVNASDE